MTAVDVWFRLEEPPGPAEMRALGRVHEVYGIRRIQFNEPEHAVGIEYDASRLSENTVAALLRRAGLKLGEKLVLTSVPNA